MVQPGLGGALDTPRTNLGDATFLNQQPDFADISQEASFQSPSKDGNFLQQLRNGRTNGVSLRTPRQRGPLADRRNLPQSVGGAEFTPLLKSATRNSVRRNGKENNAAVSNTPALNKIDEAEMSPLPRMDTSIYTGSRGQSYLDNTLPQVEASSAASTPLAAPTRRGVDKGPLQDGNGLSLREQENVIDRIEKENFGLKLKIHFLEEALRKAGPGFSEAALKENTELKVDKVTMQRELHKYKKHLTTAERDLESYRQQMQELQEKAKRKFADEAQRAEMDQLRQTIDDREAEVEELRRQINEGQQDQEHVEKLQDDIGDLEADLRQKDQLIGDKDDELEDLRDKLEEAEDKAKEAERRVAEMEQEEQQSEELQEAKDTIENLEHDIRRLEEQLDEMKEKADDAVAQKDRAEGDLEELQESMANKSVMTKGLSRQFEEKVARLQEALDRSEKEYAALDEDHAVVTLEKEELKERIQELESQNGARDDDRNRISELEDDLQARTDERDLLQTRYDGLSSRCDELEDQVAKLEQEAADLEAGLAEERQHSMEIEKDLRGQYRDEIERLNDEISDLQAEVRERDNLYDNDSDKWETEKQTLESQRERAEEKAAGLQKTIDMLREAEGSLSNKESKLKDAIASETERHKSEEAILTRQVDDLQDALETRQGMLTNLRNELSTVRDELRQTQIDYQTQADKVAALEDEVDVLQSQAADKTTTGRNDLEAAKRECRELREQVSTLRRAADTRAMASPRVSPRKTEQTSEEVMRLQRRLEESATKLEKSLKDKQGLQDNIATLNVQMHSLRSSLAEAEAERDELDGQMQRTKSNDNDTLSLDQERLDLRTAKMKLDNEVRRLKDENRALLDQRSSVERTLEEEIQKASEEEQRLGQEIRELQAKLRQTSSNETGELASSRRTIRELERRIEDYQAQLAAGQPIADDDGHSEISMIRKDLSAARQKELDFLQRESAHRDVVKGLKRQITELERKVHDDEMSRLITSPKSPSYEPIRRDEVSNLRQELTTAHQSIYDLKKKNREADRKASEATQDLQKQLEDLEDQKIVLEEVLEEARQQAEETATQHERAMRHMKRQLEKLERDRKTVGASGSGTQRTEQHLRKSHAEIENLEHDVRQQQETIDALVASEGSLRRKLERARSERAAYRMSAEKLQRDVQRAHRSGAGLEKDSRQQSLVKANHATNDEALNTVVRAAEGAEERHKKELRGMVMQMEWMQARWEREASLRSDAAYAKRFLQLQLNVANAWYVSQFPTLRLRGRGNQLTYITATRHSFANWSTSALISSATASLSRCPQLPLSKTKQKGNPRSRRSSSWPASWPACVYQPGTGPNKRRCERSLSLRRRRRGSPGRGGNSRWCEPKRQPEGVDFCVEKRRGSVCFVISATGIGASYFGVLSFSTAWERKGCGKDVYQG